jgi:hypothetical protein
MKEKNRERQKSTVNDCRDTAGDAENVLQQRLVRQHS